jgi:uncharacterized protein (TIGR02611 family)
VLKRNKERLQSRIFKRILSQNSSKAMALALRKIFIGLVGGTVLLVGVALLVLPGPGLLIIAAGVAILATEFLWARHAFRKAKCYAAKLRRHLPFGLDRWFRRRAKSAGTN